MKKIRPTMRNLLRLFAQSLHTVEGNLGMLLLVLFMFNRQLAQRVSSWDGISPWWALVPVVILFGFSIVRKLLTAEDERDSLLEELGRKPEVEQAESWDSKSFHAALSNVLIAVALVAIGAALGTEIIAPRAKYSDWKFVREVDSDGFVIHKLVDESGNEVAQFTETRWTLRGGGISLMKADDNELPKKDEDTKP